MHTGDSSCPELWSRHLIPHTHWVSSLTVVWDDKVQILTWQMCPTQRWYTGWPKTSLFSTAIVAGAVSTSFSHVLLCFSNLQYKYQPFLSCKCIFQSESQGWCTHSKFSQRKRDFEDNLFLCRTSRTLVVVWVSFWEKPRTTAYQYMGSAKKLFSPVFNGLSLYLFLWYQCYSFLAMDLYCYFILPSLCCFCVPVSAMAWCEDWMNDRPPAHHSWLLSALCLPLFGLGFQVTSLSQNVRLPKITPYYCFSEKTVTEHYIHLFGI